MRKKLWMILLAGMILMTGCTKITTERQMLTIAEDRINSAVTSEISSSTNINKGFVSFYLEPSIGRFGGNKTNSVFLVGGHDVVLTIDVSSIVTAKYYSSDNPDLIVLREVDAFPNQVYEKEGTFLSGSGLVREYRCRIYHIGEKNYGIMMQTSNIIMVAECPMSDTPDLAMMMMRILRTVRCDEEQVVTAYSQKEMIDYRKEVLDIFQKIYPENGSLADMLNDNTPGTGN